MRILVVDDEEDILKIVELTFSKNKLLDIVNEVDSKNALKRVCEDKEKFDLILLDLMMPELDGFTFMEKLKECGCNIPVVVLSAKSHIQDKTRCLKLGAIAYITKPFNPIDLKKRIENIVFHESGG